MVSYPLLIDGALVDGAETLEVVNPATGMAFTSVARASEAQMRQAVAAAKAAQPDWAARPLAERRQALLRLAEYIEAHSERIARVLVMEQGKPLSQAKDETTFAPLFLRYFAGQDLEREILQDDDQYRIEVEHRPLGVVVGITPWNFPLLIGINKLGPAVLMGNSFIWKPAPTTPVTALVLAEAFATFFPPGVVNIVVDNNDLGALLSNHPDVAKVSFTGSTATGRRVMAGGASTLKRLTLELGGNDAGIVLPDADVAKTAKRVAGSAFLNAGQVCIALKRLYVHRSIYDDMCEALVAEVSDLVVGDGLEQGTSVGPIQNANQYAKIDRYLTAAATDGRVIAGGAKIEGPGYFVQPTLVRDIEDGSPLVDEEQFAPILPIIPFDDVDEVVRRANASEFGLGGSVWSENVEAAEALASRIQSGTVWINHHTHFGPNIPFAGAKQSGIGVEFGREGLLEYSQRTVVSRAR